MRRLAGVLVAVISVILAALTGVAGPADSTSQTFQVPLDGTYSLVDGMTARVTDVSIARVAADNAVSTSDLRYLIVSVEVTRLNSNGVMITATVTSGGRTFAADTHPVSPADGVVTNTPLYFLMEKDAISGAILQLAGGNLMFRGGFHRIYSIDLGLTAKRVADLDATAEVATNRLPMTTEAVR